MPKVRGLPYVYTGNASLAYAAACYWACHIQTYHQDSQGLLRSPVGYVPNQVSSSDSACRALIPSGIQCRQDHFRVPEQAGQGKGLDNDGQAPLSLRTGSRRAISGWRVAIVVTLATWRSITVADRVSQLGGGLR